MATAVAMTQMTIAEKNFEVTQHQIALDKAKLRRIRFHDLRHTHATLLLQAGVPVAAVSARLGHANAAITLGIYSHSTSDAEAAAALVAGSLLANVLK